ncbi:MAG: class I SAM-dependent methyltransferase [Bacteroidetes bacterium]|nr:class I SAM-dependent methyltransferase [Bacteroidota bacterium]
MHQNNTCLVCGSNQFEPFLVCKDYTVSKEDFQIVSCKSCGFKFTNPRPADSVIGVYYKSEDYVSHSNTRKGLINRVYHWVRNYTLGKKLALVSRHVSRGTILDYGCGTGMFLSVCHKAGWTCFGMEPDTDARALAKEQDLPEIYSNKAELVASMGNKQADAITLWHVLEHVTDMDETLSFFKKTLSEKGILIIAVPNYKSFDAAYYKEYWAAYDVPRHLYHFSQDTMQKLLDKSGFKLVETLPMKFDSFYVSMLSEKYKTGSSSLFKAFSTGLKSNVRAKSAAEYSSVIYVFKHA